MKKLLLTLLLGLASIPASATTYYISDCVTGADPACVPGNDANNGTSPSTPWQSTSKANNNTNGIRKSNGGDSFLFAKGGSWSGVVFTGYTNDPSGTSTKSNRLKIASYVPSWGPGTAKPLFTNATGTVFNLSSNNWHEGWTIQDIEVVGGETPGTPLANGDTTGFFVYAGFRFIRIINVTSRRFYYGYEGPTSGIGGGMQSHDIYVGNCTFDLVPCTPSFPFDATKSVFTENMNGGGFSGQHNVTVENLYFTGNGNCLVTGQPVNCQPGSQRHSWYFGGDAADFTGNVTVRGTYSTNNSNTGGAGCAGTHFTGHGIIRNLLYENNTVVETTPAAQGGCYGIGYGDNYQEAGEGCYNCTFRGNTIFNVGNWSMPINTGPWLLENNMIIMTRSGGFTNCIFVEPKSFPTSNNTNGVTLRNNGCYYANGTSGAAITFTNTPEIGGGGTTTGSGTIVANNAVYIAGGTTSCWAVSAKNTSEYTIFDYNSCRQLGSGSNTPPTGRNVNGITSDPLLAAVPAAGNNYAMKFLLGSPLIDAGIAAYAPNLAIHGYPKVNARDIGPYEFGSNP